MKKDNPTPENPNLDFWEKVCQTDEKFTQSFTNARGVNLTAIDPMYRIRTLTEQFGPCGIGWGVRNEKFDTVHFPPEKSHYDLLTYHAEFWYLLEGDIHIIPIASDVPFFEYDGVNQKWYRTQDPVKSVKTDALTKGISWLGFQADTYMGRFDAHPAGDEKKETPDQETAPPPTKKAQQNFTQKTLAAGTKDYDNTLKKLIAGTITMDTVKLYYIVSPDMEKALQEAIENAQKPATNGHPATAN